MSKSVDKMSMDELDAVAHEIEQLENMQDDLYLEDVGSEKPDHGMGRGKKYIEWLTSRKARNLILRGRSKNRRRRGGGLGRGMIPTDEELAELAKASEDEDELFALEADEMNMLDEWVFDEDENDETDMLEDFILDDRNIKKYSYRNRGGFVGFGNRGQFKRGAKSVSQRQFRGGKSIYSAEKPDFDEKSEDVFDIESKSQHQQSRGNFMRTYDRSWNRDPREGGRASNSRDERGRRSIDRLDQEDSRSPSFMSHRKDPRLVGRQLSESSETRFPPSRNDPRLAPKQSSASGFEVSDTVYASARKDPRLLPQQAVVRNKDVDVTYDPTRKDPRLVAQEEKLAQLRSDPRLSTLKQQQDLHRREPFDNRFGLTRKDPRLEAQIPEFQKREVKKTINPLSDLAPPGVEPDENSDDRQNADPTKKSDQLEPTRRGPRSPSPPHSSSLSPVGKREHSPVSSSRKHDRSPGRGRSRHERSPSPRIRGERSISPRRRSRWDHEGSNSPRRRDRSLERRRDRRSGSRDRRDRSLSPLRRSRRERSLSPRSRRERPRLSREWSGSPRRDRSLSPRRDRSMSDRRDHSLSPRSKRSPFSPPHRSSLSSSRDEPWRLSPASGRLPHHYPPVQPSQQAYEVLAPPPVQNMYSDGNYGTSAQPPPGYGGPSGGPPPLPATAPPAAPPPPPPQGYHSGYQQYGYDNYYQQPAPPPYSADYTSSAPQATSWADGGMVYPDMSHPPPVQVQAPAGGVASSSGAPGTSAQSAMDKKSEEAKKEAVKNELIQQKQTLSKQREEYVRKKGVITHELQLLREQEEELLEENSKDNDRILKENHKLQLEIQNKLKAINNVIDMLTGIIGDKDSLKDKRSSKGHKEESKGEKKKPKTPPETPPESSSDSGSPMRFGRKGGDEEHRADKMQPLSMMSLEEQKQGPEDKPVYNYIHYDPEMHWCRVCNVFPRTAKEYLNHLHCSTHKEETLERKLVDMPWHKIQADQEVAIIPGAPTKRTPIRGLQFFISATAWYCKLCDVWIGDLHCASLHLKSKRHAENYARFTEQNPHWETDWLADREKAYELCSEKRHRVKEEQKTLPGNLQQHLPAASGKQFSNYNKNAFVEVKPVPKEEKDDQKSKKKGKDHHKKIKKTCITALDETKKKKHRKKKGKSKKSHNEESSSSSTGSSSSGSSSSDDSDLDKSKSIRVTMRNRTKGQVVQQPSAQVTIPRSRWDSPEKLSDKEEGEIDEPVEKVTAEQEKTEWQRLEAERIERDEKERKLKKSTPKSNGNSGDDKLIREWMSTSKDVSDGEKQLLNSIKDRLKQKQEADKERERERKRDFDTKGYYDDRRDSKKGRRHSESPSSPTYRSKRSRANDKSPDDRRDRSSRSDKYDKNEGSHNKSPERSSKKSPTRRDSVGAKSEQQKPKEVTESKVPEKKTEVEKKATPKVEEEEEEDEESAESKFEKQTAESAAKLMKKNKKPPVMAIPKSKLPFIGRMPILKHFAKKKGPLGKSATDGKTEEEDKKQIPDDPLVQAQYSLEFTNVGGKVHIGPQAPRKSRFDEKPAVGPDLPTVGPKLPPNVVAPTSLGNSENATDVELGDKTAVPEETVVRNEVQDMEIDEDTTNSDNVAPVIETAAPIDEVENPTVSPKKPLTDIPLPKDFQDALNILFPGAEGSEKKEEYPPAGTQLGVIQSGPKPPSQPQNGCQMTQEQWGQQGPQMGGPPMMQMHGPHPMQGYGGSPQGPPHMMGGGGPPMMGPMHGMHGPPMQGPPGGHPNMQGPPGMYGPQGPGYGMHGPRGAMMGHPNMMHSGPQGHGPPMHPHQAEVRPPRPPLPKDKSPTKTPVAKNETPAKKPGVAGKMSADELALLGIDAEDMAVQSF